MIHIRKSAILAASTALSMLSLEALLRRESGPGFLVFAEVQDPADKIEELQLELVELNQAALNLQNRADAEKRPLSEEESTEVEKIFARFEAVEAEIERRQTIAAQIARAATPQGRRTDPDDVANASREDGGDGAEAGGSPRGARRRTRVHAQPHDPTETGRGGFRNLGEFMQSVRAIGPGNSGRIDPRLTANAPTTTTQESVGGDGGFAVPPDFRQAIMVKVMGEESLVPRTDQLTTSSNSITVPMDETTPWQSSGGVQAHWEGEGQQIAQSKVSLTQNTIRLNKVSVLMPVTEEQLEDAPQLTSYINQRAPEAIRFKIDDAIIDGTGTGQPLGILNSGALVTVSKESGQAADTVVFQNVVNMWSRLYAPCRPRSVWLINQDIETQLLSMQFPGTGTAVPVYLPAGGLANNPYGTLMGRPVLPKESCKTLGDKGDIILTDLSRYMTGMKTGGIRQDVSMHLYFDYQVAAFRFVLRMSGQPWWSAPITPANGSNSRSCFVTLEAR